MDQSTIEEILQRLHSLDLADANEAETRKKVLDRVIYEILGWTDDDVSYEERVSEDGKTTYADYIVRTANTAFVIEAKRIGNALLRVPTRRKAKLDGVIMRGDTGKAITQARDYCRTKSIPHAVVTNGENWIIFPANRVDQVEFVKSHAIIFESLKSALVEDLDLFLKVLSRDSVIEGNLDYELLGRIGDQIETRRLKNFYKGSGSKPTNPIYPLIESSVITAFSDVEMSNNIDLLARCYVQNADRIKFDKRISMHLNKSEPLFEERTKKPLRKREKAILNRRITESSKGVRPLAILLLGSVGSGKTTFLSYTRRVASASFFKTKSEGVYPHWIEVDFRKYVNNEGAASFIYREIFEYLNSDPFFTSYEQAIKKAYEMEIEALKRGVMFLLAKNPDKFDEKITNLILSDFEKVTPFVDKLLKYASSKVPIYLVVDNVDQVEDEDSESDIFADAIAMANKLGLNLIISMRESTYVKHRNTPTFDAFDFDPFQIEPPEVREVLSKRFQVVNELLKGKKGEFTADNGVLVKTADLSDFTELVQGSVLGTEIGNKISVLANNDIRLALRMTREFLARGYTDPGKAMSVFKEKGEYVLPPQEAFKSILLGNQPVYSEEFSVIGNPFDSRLDRTNEQLLRLYILNMMVKVSTERNSNYVESQYVFKNLNSIGFSEADVIKVLSDLCDLRFIHTSSHSRPDSNSRFYPSRLGGYVTRHLISDMTFLEQVMMDTFIPDRKVWDELRELTDQIADTKKVVSRLVVRIERVKKFYDSMAGLYKPLVDESILRGLDSNWLDNPLELMKPRLIENLTRAQRSAEKNYGAKST